jgi:hypothetical protein
MDVSEIKTAFGAYYENSGQNMKRILGMLSQGLVTPGICTPVKTDDTVSFRLSKKAGHLKMLPLSLQTNCACINSK